MNYLYLIIYLITLPITNPAAACGLFMVTALPVYVIWTHLVTNRVNPECHCRTPDYFHRQSYHKDWEE